MDNLNPPLGVYTLPFPVLEGVALTPATARRFLKGVFADAAPSSANIDLALDAIKKLNTLWVDFKEKFEHRELNSSTRALKYRVFRVGSVIAHRDSKTRAVVIGWSIDSNDRQLLNILVDQFDSTDLGHGLVKTVQTNHPSELFLPVTDPSLLRVHHDSIPQYFSEFDSVNGCYLPNSALRHAYPLDSPEASSASTEDIDAAAARVIEAVRTIGAKVVAAAYARNICPIPPDAIRESPFTKKVLGGPTVWASSHMPLLATANEITSLVLDDVLLAAQQCKNLTCPAETAETSSNLQQKAITAISYLVNFISTTDQILQLRFQSRGAGYFEELVPQASLAGSAALQAPATTGEEPLVDDSVSPPLPTFYVGQIVRHLKFGYRGVITGMDMRPLLDVSTWEGVVGLPSGTEQPFYRVVPDEGDVEQFLGNKMWRASYYCAQENLEPVTKRETDAGRAPVPQHRHLPLFFAGFDVANYSFKVPHKLRFCFPRPPGSLPPSADIDQVEDLAAADAEALLLEAWSIVKKALVDSRISHAAQVAAAAAGAGTTTTDALEKEKERREGVADLHCGDLLALLKHTSRRENALVVESLMWMLMMSHASARVSRTMRQGVSNMKRGRTAQAFECFNLASQLDPSFAEPHNKLAALHHKASEHSQCAFRAQRCLELWPEHYGALAGLGISLEKIGKTSQAISKIRSALQIHPWAGHLPTVLNTMFADERDRGEE